MELKDFGIEITHTGKTTCPKCSESRKNSSDKCLSVDFEKKVWNCHNCGWKGVAKSRIPKKAYFKPAWNNNTALSDKIVQFFKSRAISQQTIIEFKISEKKEFMPQTQKEENCICFNYFLNSELLNTKFRDGAKNFKMVKDAELIFYNLDSTISSDTIYIVEGEIDCLSVYECGIKNVVSVPNGASKGNNKLEYLDNCFEYFEGKQIVIATDNDPAGISLKNELARRIGIDNCTWIDFDYCKDANEYLVKYGPIKLADKLNDLKQFPISGVIYLKDINEDIDDLYTNGFPAAKKTGINELDELISFEEGTLVIVTGIPNHGKSEFVDYISCLINIKHKMPGAIFSPENFPLKYHFGKLAEKIIGKRFWGHERMNVIEKNQAKEYIGNNIFFIRPDDENFSIDVILQKAVLLVKKHGIKYLIIDPYNRLEHQMDKGVSETNYVSNLLDKIITFKQKYNCLVFLIAHPRKINKNKTDGMYEVPNLYDISGSSNFFNKADVGITVYRNFKSNLTEVYIQKVRFKHWGQQGVVSFNWNELNGRYTNDMSNWLIKNIEYNINKDPNKTIEPNKDFLDETEQRPDPFDNV